MDATYLRTRPSGAAFPMRRQVIGRLAPSPSGRMHLGNAFAALLAWLSARAEGGRILLRLEDLDIDRCRREYGTQLMDDLRWLGLDWDGDPIWQTDCLAHYDAAFEMLRRMELLYPCWCSRAERLAASAPHRGEASEPNHSLCRGGCRAADRSRQPAWLIQAPAEADCEDYIIRRSDGVYAYQFAVVADDGRMGVTQVVRGADLLSSTPRQIWLHRVLGYEPPLYRHVPLLLAPDGRRLSKRDGDLDFAALRTATSPEAIVGMLAHLAGLRESQAPIAAQALVEKFNWSSVGKEDIIVS